MSGMGEKYLEAGFDYYLPMPVSLQELDELITTYFGDKVKTYVEDRPDYEEISLKEKEPVNVEEVKPVKLIEENQEEETVEKKEDSNPITETQKADIVEEYHNEEKAEEYTKEEEPIEETSNEDKVEESTKEEEPIKETSNEENPTEAEREENEETLSAEEFLRNKGVDMDKSLEFLMDMEMYNMTLNDFLAEIDEKWNHIKEYKENQDMKNYSIEVHSLKSDCKYLGFMKLADISYEHELKGKENNVEFVNQNFNKLEEEFNNTMALIKEYTEKYNINVE
jgi:HPt (histidine-containing phosphotransfer) domain-containing protein